MPEYLHYPEPEWLQRTSLEEMFRAGRVIAPAVLCLDILPAAKDLLLTTEGPNLDRRQFLGAAWMERIISYLSDKTDDGGLYQDSYRLVELDNLKYRLETHSSNGSSSGVLFMATGEANLGHLWAWEWMQQYVTYPVGLFEPDSYFDLNPARRKPFLPLKVRLSIASHLGLYTSVLASRDPNEADSAYYQRMFDLSGADYCFASDDDQNVIEKIRRGKWANFLVISDLDYPHTSDAAQKLMPDPEEWLWPRLR